jgi:hypothetical protein
MSANESDQTKSSADSRAPKKGWYQRYTDARIGRNITIPEEDMKKYLGRDRAEYEKFAATAPGVGPRQVSGQVQVASISGGATALSMLGNEEKHSEADGKE